MLHLALISPLMVGTNPFWGRDLPVDPAQIGLLEALPVAVAIPLTCWQDGSAGAFIMGLRHGARTLVCRL